MKKNLKCGLKAGGTRVFIATESGLGYEKRERGIQFNSDPVRESSSTRIR